ncbi:MAG: hypothetical protein HY791_34915 [Deltaproteobacteria bacterium]|nr:hypothetical protein [Deltaproteobacteria bacterium]
MSGPASEDSLALQLFEFISRDGGPKPDASSLDARSREQLVALLSAQKGPALRAAVQTVLELAYYVYSELGSEPTALALVEVAGTQKAALSSAGKEGEELARRVAGMAADKAEVFRSFAGEQRRTLGPDTPPPEGSVRNSPMARFALRSPPAKDRKK